MNEWEWRYKKLIEIFKEKEVEHFPVSIDWIIEKAEDEYINAKHDWHNLSDGKGMKQDFICMKCRKRVSVTYSGPYYPADERDGRTWGPCEGDL